MKIYDTFTFFNELDLLEIRLNVLNDVVDRFVIAESNRTFQNREKPLYFQLNKQRFSKFLHKIIHIVVDDMPDSKDTRLLESHQRNSIERGLTFCEPGDQILLSDLDEIPNPRTVKNVANSTGIRAFRQSLYYYYINYACKELHDLPWTIMADFDGFMRPQDMRQRLITAQASLLSGNMELDVELIDCGGWHFSYLGGVDAIIKKLSAFADPEYNKKAYQDSKRISQAISEGSDLFGRDFSFCKVPLNDHFPDYIRNNLGKIRHLIHE
jgi:beta-1,4-mannosyl-glycoprotein beta-1,4-N-acetylglucosaminyltransferase